MIRPARIAFQRKNRRCSDSAVGTHCAPHCRCPSPGHPLSGRIMCAGYGLPRLHDVFREGRRIEVIASRSRAHGDRTIRPFRPVRTRSKQSINQASDRIENLGRKARQSNHDSGDLPIREEHSSRRSTSKRRRWQVQNITCYKAMSSVEIRNPRLARSSAAPWRRAI